MFHGKGMVEDTILDLDNPLGELVDLLISFEKDDVSVSKVKTTREGGQLSIDFDLPDD